MQQLLLKSSLNCRNSCENYIVLQQHSMLKQIAKQVLTHHFILENNLINHIVSTITLVCDNIIYNTSKVIYSQISEPRA